MKRKEVLYAVIGGCFGALIAMLVGLFIPVGIVAQSQPTDAVFHTIQCKGIEVVDESGETTVRIRSSFYGGDITVRGNKGKGVAALSVGEYGGTVWLEGNSGEPSAVMRSTDHGGEIVVSNLSGHKRVEMYVLDGRGFVDVKGLWPTVFARLEETKYGGRVSVFSQGEHRAVMSVDENGNGAVSTWDKNGYRQ